MQNFMQCKFFNLHIKLNVYTYVLIIVERQGN